MNVGRDVGYVAIGTINRASFGLLLDKERENGTIRAQPIYKTKELHYHWRRFKIWEQDSMLLYPVLFMLGAIALVWITTGLDAYLIDMEICLWATTKPGVGVSITSLVSSSVLSLLAIGFSVSMVTLQLANQQYTPRVIHLFTRSSVTKLALSLFIATFVYSFILQAEVLGTRVEEIAIVSVSTNILLMFSCLIVFIFVMKSVRFMSWPRTL